jgi:hypothetical protein
MPAQGAVATPAQQALTQARALEQALRLPGGARPAATLPPVLSEPFSMIGTTQLVHLVRRVEIPGTAPAALQRDLASRPPAGTTVAGTGTAGGQRGTTTWSVTFAPRHLDPAVDRAELVVAIATAGAGSALRADAEVAWLEPHPAVALVPVGVANATVSRTAAGRAGPLQQVQLHTGAPLRRIVAVFDSLPENPPGTQHCPASFGVSLVVSFPATSTSPPITAAAGNCGVVGLEVGSSAGPALLDRPGTWSGQLAELLAGALGFHSWAVWQPAR